MCLVSLLFKSEPLREEHNGRTRIAFFFTLGSRILLHYAKPSSRKGEEQADGRGNVGVGETGDALRRNVERTQEAKKGPTAAEAVNTKKPRSMQSN